MIRKYFNKIEENYFTMLICILKFMSGDVEGCKDKGMLLELEDNKMFTASSKKNYKLGITYLKKFIEETYNNLDKSTQDKIYKRTDKFYLSFISKYDAMKLERDIANKTIYAVLERQDFEELIEDITEVRCLNCTKNYCDCNIYNAIDESLKLEGNGTKNNCKYSWRK